MEKAKTAQHGDDFIDSIDPGLLAYRNELYLHSVTSEATLRFLRQREVYELNIPDIYTRLLVDKIISLQTPEGKKRMKCEQMENSPETFKLTKPKRLFEPVPTTDNRPIPSEKSPGFLDSELYRLNDTRDSLSILLVHKKDEVKVVKSAPVPPAPLAIPGGAVLKSTCDKCHHRGHKAYGNKNNQPCPYEKCVGYHFCGIMTKHKDFKQEICKVEKEVTDLEKEIKSAEESIKGIKAFISHNMTNFVAAVRPILRAKFPRKYMGKDGAQNLHRDLRFRKVALDGKIPENFDKYTTNNIETLINSSRAKISAKCGDIDGFTPIETSTPTINTTITPANNVGMFPWVNGCFPVPEFSQTQTPYQPIVAPQQPYLYQFPMIPMHYPSPTSTVSRPQQDVDGQVFPPPLPPESGHPTPPPPPPPPPGMYTL